MTRAYVPLTPETLTAAVEQFKVQCRTEDAPNWLFLANDVLDTVTRDYRDWAINVVSSSYTCVFTRPDFVPGSWWLARIEGRIMMDCPLLECGV